MTSRLHETVLMKLRTAASRHADEIVEADHPVWDDMTQAAIAAVLEAMETVSDAQIRAVRGRDPAPDYTWQGEQDRGTRQALASVWCQMLAAFREEQSNGH